jgi:hypothetical protein
VATPIFTQPNCLRRLRFVFFLKKYCHEIGVLGLINSPRTIYVLHLYCRAWKGHGAANRGTLKCIPYRGPWHSAEWSPRIATVNSLYFRADCHRLELAASNTGTVIATWERSLAIRSTLESALPRDCSCCGKPRAATERNPVSGTPHFTSRVLLFVSP